MLNRDQAQELRNTVKALFNAKFKKMKDGNSRHISPFTHSNILWKNFTPAGMPFNSRFMGLEITVQPPRDPNVQTDIFRQFTAQMQPQIKEVANDMKDCLQPFSAQPLEFKLREPSNRKRGEEFMVTFLEEHKIELIHFTKDDSNGWGRPSIVLVIPFE